MAWNRGRNALHGKLFLILARQYSFRSHNKILVPCNSVAFGVSRDRSLGRNSAFNPLPYRRRYACSKSCKNNPMLHSSNMIVMKHECEEGSWFFLTENN
ncbi:hypothetical protein CW304_12060 [Bacillus sp. UFRGS-B20]|nr:hypothetical protein CW304_12060 [Bacillus sp. UFRGS-B20]